jgi:MoxR-like ATPase
VTAIERLATADFIPTKKVVYVDTNRLHDLYDPLAYKANLILVGPKGIGKSLSVASWASKHAVPTITFDCSEDVRRSHIIGMHVLRGDSTPFVLGPLTSAYEIANEVGKCVLIFEEVNALTPQMQKLLNSSTDFRRKIEVPECGRIFQLKEGAQLWIVGTMNTTVYGGVYALNEDLKSRFRLIALDYPAPKEEKAVVLEVIGGRVQPDLIDKVLIMAHETRQKAVEYALSSRDVVQVLEDIAAVGLDKGLWVALGKFEGDDRATMRERMKSIFGVTLK